MAAPTIVIDGAQPYGVPFVGTIGGNTFIVESFNVSRPQTIAEDRTQTGAAQRWRSTTGFAEAAAVIQAPAGTSGWPQRGDTLGPVTVDANYGAETWAVIEVPAEYSNDPSVIRKINVTFRKVLNGITTVA